MSSIGGQTLNSVVLDGTVSEHFFGAEDILEENLVAQRDDSLQIKSLQTRFIRQYSVAFIDFDPQCARFYTDRLVNASRAVSR